MTLAEMVLASAKKVNSNAKIRGSVDQQIAERDAIMAERAANKVEVIAEPVSELESLKLQAKRILDNNAHWKSCQDGSYEMALHNAGYHNVMNKIGKLEK